jgi:outer membrane lipoprotein-sorting protein
MGGSKRPPRTPVYRYALLLAAASAASLRFAAAQPETPDANWMARAIEAKCAARQYTFDAAIELARKRGEDSREMVASFKVKLAIAPEGKFLLWVSEKDRLVYVISSDGRNTWAFMPDLNRYVRLDAGDAGILPDPDDIFLNGIEDGDRDPVLCSKLVIPILARLARGAELMEMTRLAEVKIRGEDRQLPVLTVLSPKNERAGQSLTDVVVDPETLDIVQMDWTRSAGGSEEQRFVSLRAAFENLRLGEPLPASYFVLNPPGDAQLVDELPAPGLDGSRFVGKPAPDFELQGSGGSKIHLADLRGRVIALAFSGAACAMCERQIADLASIQAKYKDKGVSMFVIATAPDIAGGTAPAVPILDDAAARVHRLYRIQLAPTLVIIDGAGKLVRYLPGARNAAMLEAALKSAGL